ncbi:hypothetical protein TTHERM_00670880 (macronuclear) [Tetrahymena thermophila SB210]|uniref:Uncharacterized protein n=1 Tax=Tetrahymena thermophila (strain SB210) TaxID=312017 RepID=I7MAU5_TETTS|nr:hypothetical protein TTHERM_00670880 [Tetrahymena thermophila SB210]EAS06164.1 hypothetical protein TTHERM_00670880 [Tetrahymena thermophila SB210]|eukprot:XP_001026409.1 hypothetical protein TTHERM_00670880 [Tetrahymena thermophila SB210]
MNGSAALIQYLNMKMFSQINQKLQLYKNKQNIQKIYEFLRTASYSQSSILI